MDVILLVVGDELLSGDTLDTNSHFLACELSNLGYNIVKILTISDQESILKEELEWSFQQVDIVFTTGGLGPTNDDMTKEIVAKVFGQELILNEKALKNLIKALRSRQDLLEVNKKQAYFPESAEVILNDLGTAPGGILQKDSKRAFLLPGPSSQCQHIFKKMIPFLKNSDKNISKKVLKTLGLFEAEIYKEIKDLMFLKNPTVRIYTGKEGRSLVLTARDTEEKSSEKLLEDFELEIRTRIGDYIYGGENDRIETVLMSLLEKYDLTIATGESFTGGEIASRLVSVPGMSHHLFESFVTYSEQAKEKYLAVSREKIEKYGVVSKEVCEEMLIGLEKLTSRDLLISSTGFAGPGENAGLCYLGVSYKGNKRIFKNEFTGNRNSVRRQAVQLVLFQSWRMILDQEELC